MRSRRFASTPRIGGKNSDAGSVSGGAETLVPRLMALPGQSMREASTTNAPFPYEVFEKPHSKDAPRLGNKQLHNLSRGE